MSSSSLGDEDDDILNMLSSLSLSLSEGSSLLQSDNQVEEELLESEHEEEDNLAAKSATTAEEYSEFSSSEEHDNQEDEANLSASSSEEEEHSEQAESESSSEEEEHSEQGESESSSEDEDDDEEESSDSEEESGGDASEEEEEEEEIEVRKELEAINMESEMVPRIPQHQRLASEKEELESEEEEEESSNSEEELEAGTSENEKQDEAIVETINVESETVLGIPQQRSFPAEEDELEFEEDGLLEQVESEVVQSPKLVITNEEGDGSYEVTDDQAKSLSNVFEKYCKYGSLGNSAPSKLNSARFNRFIEDCGLAGQIQNQKEVLFMSCANGKDHLEFEEFMECLGLLAVGVFPDAPSFVNSMNRLLNEFVFVVNDSMTQICTRDKGLDVALTLYKTGDSVEEDSIQSKSMDDQSKSSSSGSSSSGTYETVSTENLPQLGVYQKLLGQAEDEPVTFEQQTVRLDKESVAALLQIYESYSKHWCSGVGRQWKRSLRRQNDMEGRVREPKTESLLRTSTGFRWSEKLCFGGFATFVTDYSLEKTFGSILEQNKGFDFAVMVKEAFRSGVTGAQQTAANDDVYSYELDFTQFLSAVTSLSVAPFKNVRGFVKFGAAVRKLIDQCIVQQKNMIYCSKSTIRCMCESPGRQIQVEIKLLPFECQFDRQAIKVLEDGSEILRNIFVYYCDRGEKQIQIPACVGCKCGGPLPMLCESGFLKFAQEFELMPRFLSESQTVALFHAVCSDQVGTGGTSTMMQVSTVKTDTRLSFQHFIAILAHAALIGLSRYPYSSLASSAVEKVTLLMKKMQVSQGMRELFYPNVPEFTYEDMKKPTVYEKVLQRHSPHARRPSQPVAVEDETLSQYYYMLNEQNQDGADGLAEVSTLPIPKEMTILQAVEGLDFIEQLGSRRGITKSEMTCEMVKPRKKKQQAQELYVSTEPTRKSMTRYEKVLKRKPIKKNHINPHFKPTVPRERRDTKQIRSLVLTRDQDLTEKRKPKFINFRKEKVEEQKPPLNCHHQHHNHELEDDEVIEAKDPEPHPPTQQNSEDIKKCASPMELLPRPQFKQPPGLDEDVDYDDFTVDSLINLSRKIRSLSLEEKFNFAMNM